MDGIVICDHNTIEGGYRMAEWVEENSVNLLIIPGVEVSTSKGHLIVLLPQRNFSIGISPEELIKIAHGDGSLVVAPHPFHRFRHGIGKIKGVDAIEVINSKYILPYSNKLAERYARAEGIPEVGGSDSHVPSTVGIAYTEVYTNGGVDDILEALRNGKTKAFGGRTPLQTLATQFSWNVKRRVKKFMKGYHQ